MILHLGSDYAVPIREVFLILDYERTMVCSDTAACIQKIKKNAKEVVIEKNKVRSLVFTQNSGGNTIYYSPLLSKTLSLRMK